MDNLPAAIARHVWFCLLLRCPLNKTSTLMDSNWKALEEAQVQAINAVPFPVHLSILPCSFDHSDKHPSSFAMSQDYRPLTNRSRPSTLSLCAVPHAPGIKIHG